MAVEKYVGIPFLFHVCRILTSEVAALPPSRLQQQPIHQMPGSNRRSSMFEAHVSYTDTRGRKSLLPGAFRVYFWAAALPRRFPQISFLPPCSQILY